MSSPGILREPLWRKLAERVLEDIQRGLWIETLPGEHQLANYYEVGRRTVRDGLLALEKEGVIKTTPGKPREVLFKAPLSKRDSDLPDHVLLMSPYAEDQGITKSRIVFNRMFQDLAKYGIHLVPRRIGTGSNKDLNRKLGQLKKQYKRSVWVLHDCSGAVQRWCEKHGECALVLGAKIQGGAFTSIEMDAGKVITHAISHLAAKGHEPSDIMLLIRRGPEKINQQAANLFRDAVEEKSPGSSPRILQHDKANLIDLLKQKLGEAHPPTGLLCWRTHDAIRTVTFLTHQGVSIPEKLSVISCGSAPAMEFIHPEITRFLSPTVDYERCFIGQLEKLIQGDLRSGKEFRFIPEFLEGKTVTKPHRK
jgi:DNA-binding LacI/PurR family transcriptional regulator